MRLTSLQNIAKMGVSIMKYYFSKTLDVSFEDAVSRVTEGLKKEGFGILTEIDVKETLKKKLDVDFKKYKILGACNPPFAYQALQIEDKIGAMLPCNVVVQESGEGNIEVSAVDPIASMQAVQNPNLQEIAEQLKRLTSEGSRAECEPGPYLVPSRLHCRTQFSVLTFPLVGGPLDLERLHVVDVLELQGHSESGGDVLVARR